MFNSLEFNKSYEKRISILRYKDGLPVNNPACFFVYHEDALEKVPEIYVPCKD